ncbi:MAG: adenylyl-sulfate kinase [Bacteroidota bacterium]|jgi:adenylyl-sulfate kinase
MPNRFALRNFKIVINPATVSVLWLYGRSGAGKSTLAQAISAYLQAAQLPYVWLDGDAFRKSHSADLGFSAQDRAENMRRAALVAQDAHTQGKIVIASFISPEQAHREVVSHVLGRAVFFCHVHASLETCQARDVKGLYAQAQAGQLVNFTGISAPFESGPDFTVQTDSASIEACVQQIISKWMPN